MTAARRDFRPRIPPEITERIERYAAAHPRRDDTRGESSPLSLNAATLELLEAALRASDLLGAPLRVVDAPP